MHLAYWFKEKIMKDYSLFEVILEFDPSGVKRLELQSSKIKDCNDALADSIGYAREELIGHPLQEICESNSIEDFSSLNTRNFPLRKSIDSEEKKTILECENILKNIYRLTGL